MYQVFVYLCNLKSICVSVSVQKTDICRHIGESEDMGQNDNLIERSLIQIAIVNVNVKYF